MQSFTRRRAVCLGFGASTLLGSRPVMASPENMFAKFTLGSRRTVDHARWDRQTKAFVEPDATNLNRVDYARWKSNGHAELKAYVAALQAVDPSMLDKPEQFAFWANLYNARTVDIVLDKYPVGSIKDIALGGGLKALVGGGPWQAITMAVSGVDLSLDDVEHKILRVIFKDARVHYALNCASYGCPNLRIGAFTGRDLSRQLDEAARAFVNHPRGIGVERGRVKASSIYSWFVTDFGGTAGKVLDHVRAYADADLHRKLEGITTIAAYDYVWTLNDITR